MQWRWSLTSGTIGAVALLGFDLMLDMFGAKQLIADAIPILRAFLPAVGFGLLVGTIVAAASVVRAWDRMRSVDIVGELEYFSEAVSSFIAKGMTSRLSAGTGMSSYDATRFQNARVIGEKHSSWLYDDESVLLNNRSSLERSVRFAAIFRIHGYIRGRRLIGKELRKIRAQQSADQR